MRINKLSKKLFVENNFCHDEFDETLEFAIFFLVKFSGNLIFCL